MEFSKQTFIKKVIRFLFKQGNNYRNVMKEALLSGIFLVRKENPFSCGQCWNSLLMLVTQTRCVMMMEYGCNRYATCSSDLRNMNATVTLLVVLVLIDVAGRLLTHSVRKRLHFLCALHRCVCS